MQGLFVEDQMGRTARPTSKKRVKEIAREAPETLIVEATSVFGNEFGGYATNLPEGQPVYFVGPDPYTSRKFYGTITRVGAALKVS